MKDTENRCIVSFHFNNKTDLDFKETLKVIKDSYKEIGQIGPFKKKSLVPQHLYAPPTGIQLPAALVMPVRATTSVPIDTNQQSLHYQR